MENINFDFISLVSIVIGTIMVIAYVIRRYRKNKGFPEIGEILGLLLPAIAMPQGVYVCTLAFNEQVINCIGISPTFLFIGGITIFWVSLERMVKIFSELKGQ